MCTLTGKEIFRCRNKIFSRKSWSSESFQEASYDLRVDTMPVLRIGGKLYENDVSYEGSYMSIKPGEMALLPTVESFNMPCNLVGDIKIKFSHSRKGLTPLFGPKIDPYYGKGHSDERLYLWVSNLGIGPITLRRGERVFTVQFHQLVGDPPDFKPKPEMGPLIAREAYSMGVESSIGFVDVIEKNVKNELGSRLARVEEGTGRVVLFGVFLVSAALLAGAITTLFSLLSNDKDISGQAIVDAVDDVLLLQVLYWGSVVLAISLSAWAIVFVLKGLAITLWPAATHLWLSVRRVGGWISKLFNCWAFFKCRLRRAG